MILLQNSFSRLTQRFFQINYSYCFNQGFKGSYYDKEFHTPAEIIRLIKDDITIANAKGNAQIIDFSLRLKSVCNN